MECSRASSSPAYLDGPADASAKLAFAVACRWEDAHQTESCSTHCAERAYIGRKPSYTRDRFNEVRDMLRQEAMSIAQIARETGLTRQTVHRIQG
jgi:predicted Rossmann fold nucleotide-binding protein DprA/Smf involved in DNA uptake